MVKLTRKNVPFKFDEACQRAFTPILIHYRPNRATKLETDSSDEVVGAVLSQLYEEDNQWHPVAFFMATAECNYEIHGREMLAII